MVPVPLAVTLMWGGALGGALSKLRSGPPSPSPPPSRSGKRTCTPPIPLMAVYKTEIRIWSRSFRTTGPKHLYVKEFPWRVSPARLCVNRRVTQSICPLLGLLYFLFFKSTNFVYLTITAGDKAFKPSPWVITSGFTGKTESKGI